MVKNVLLHANKKRLVAEFCRLVRIPSHSGEEQKMISYCVNTMRALGLTPYYERHGKTGNIIARRKGLRTCSPLLISAHLDTVQPGIGIKPKVKGDIITSDGTTILGADDKAAIAIIFEMLKIIRNKNDVIPLEIVFTHSEEIGLHGAKQLNADRLKSTLGFVLDSDGPAGTIVNAAPHHVTFKIELFGRSTHAGMEPEKGINAIVAAGELITRIPQGGLDSETTSNLGIIQGGTATNTIAGYVLIRGEVRSHSEVKLQKQFTTIKKALNAVKKKYSVKTRFIPVREYRAYKLKKNAAVMQLAYDGIRTAGLAVRYKSINGGSDANIFNMKKIPCVNLGINMKNVHSLKERIGISDMMKSVEVMLGILKTSPKYCRR